MFKKLLLSTFTMALSFSVWANDAFFQGAEALDKGDVKSAISFFEQATREGHDVAPYTLGTLYEKGEVVMLDLYEAKEWYSKAAQRGHHGGKQRLKRVNAKILDLENPSLDMSDKN